MEPVVHTSVAAGTQQTMRLGVFFWGFIKLTAVGPLSGRNFYKHDIHRFNGALQQLYSELCDLLHELCFLGGTAARGKFYTNNRHGDSL